MKVKGLFFLIFLSVQVYSNTDSTHKELSLNLEFRPRTEFRNGYQNLRTDNSTPAFFTSQRARLTLQYTQNKNFNVNISLQDVRFWGEDDPRSTDGTLQLFEAYVEPKLNSYLSLRIGKQRIMYDNERLFAQNDWRQNAGTHDAVRLLFQKKSITGDLIAAFNQNQERVFETYYTPNFNFYKSLFANFWNVKLDSHLTLTTIHATEGFQNLTNLHNTYYRNTSGGRIEYRYKNTYLTIAGYYQYGQTPTGNGLSAFYIQPELQLTLTPKTKLFLGAELFSGDDATKPSSISHSFDALYGVNHRFLGTMDYFTRFPRDFNNAGIIDPYLFLFYDITPKLSIRSDAHAFFSQNHVLVDNQVINQYLAFEHDLLLIFKPNSYTKLDFGVSWLKAEKSMEYIKQGGNSNKIAQWAYIQVTFKPELFKWSSKTTK